jgi:hypothetical protein
MDLEGSTKTKFPKAEEGQTVCAAQILAPGPDPTSRIDFGEKLGKLDKISSKSRNAIPNDGSVLNRVYERVSFGPYKNDGDSGIPSVPRFDGRTP